MGCQLLSEIIYLHTLVIIIIIQQGFIQNYTFFTLVEIKNGCFIKIDGSV